MFISSNPPVAGTLLPLLFRRKTCLLIYNIYPDGLVAGSFVTQKSILFRSWAWLNRKAYKRVGKIVTLTPGMANALKNYSPGQNISVVPAWAGANPQLKQILPAENVFINKYHLQGKFIVMYSGNIGKEYELEPLIHLAAMFSNQPQVVFVIIGNGWKKPLLEKQIAERQLQNCLLLPYQPVEVFSHILSAFDVGVVALAEKVSEVAIPSKTYNLLAAHKPVFCIGSENSYLACFLKENNIGTAVEPHRLQAMYDFISKLYQDNAYYQNLCENAAATAEQYTKQRAKEIVDIFEAA
jgi:glycosyltransferase involved in cell wall biosynthesis